MFITPQQQYPQPELQSFAQKESTADWATFSHQYNEQQLNYLAYSVKRDFLSTPRTYAVLEFQGSEDFPVIFQQYESQRYFMQSEIESDEFNWDELECGFYLLSQDQANAQLMILLLDRMLVEIEFSQCRLVDTLYHHADSKTALTEYIDSL